MTLRPFREPRSGFLGLPVSMSRTPASSVMVRQAVVAEKGILEVVPGDRPTYEEVVGKALAERERQAAEVP